MVRRAKTVKKTAEQNLRFQEDQTLIIHLTVTGRCNARCRGCINSAITMGNPAPRDSLITFEDTRPERDLRIIRKIARRFPGQPIGLCFYGGEPFLAAEKMAAVWQGIKDSRLGRRTRYMVYTNAERVIEAIEQYPAFIRDVWLFSVSIDGDRRQHNRARPGTDLTKIVTNLRALREVRRGQVLMWSTLREEQSLAVCHDEFQDLRAEGLVDHFYWHWPEIVEPFRDIEAYARGYALDLEKIMKEYVRELDRGSLPPIIQVNELVLFLLTGRQRGHTGCAIELMKNYDIVSGKIYSCVDLPAELGDLEKNRDPRRLVSYRDELGCRECPAYGYCGGRCPVQGLYGSLQRTREYCRLMKLHVGIVRNHLPRIRTALKKRRLGVQEIYDRSAGLTRFTDVTP
jgi:radical SAM protein with 4Fe4S-binding SPASM domain